ncbi:MAG: DNA-binding response regulator [Hydrocarboniphaga sp.]|uniref:response regulator transcription factor n=1 Tax=Hydrocarboniphaga sp. TaxID=2033016 RepID=UPI00261E9E0E|nr:response regulator transcription factor [Hydrocarboniphaga sp.]MDB5972242.1 DNA-binding response regulator [Hydrocarboniphaga sp.]
MDPVATETELAVIIADDHPLFRVALRLGVRSVAPLARTVEVDTFDSLKTAAAAHPDAALVLLDLLMPGAEALSSLEFLRSHFPALRVAIVSGVEQGGLMRTARALGAVGFVHKSATPEIMQRALHQLLGNAGSWWPEPAATEAPMQDAAAAKLERLSRQELRVLLQIKDGRLNKQIAGDLGISESTVKSHISTILHKLDLRSRTQVAVFAQKLLSGTQ